MVAIGVVVIAAAIAVPITVLGSSPPTKPAVLSSTITTVPTPLHVTRRTPPGTPHLYTEMRSTSLGTVQSPTLLTASPSAVYLRGTEEYSDNLFRVSLQPFALTTSTLVSGLNEAAYGLGALWAAAGDLVRVDPTSLAVTATYPLPGTVLLVTVAAGKLWVATRTNLLAVDPTTGAVQRTEPLGFLPQAMAASPNRSVLYVVGDKQPPVHARRTVNSARLASFDSTNGALLGERTIGRASTGAIATTKNGVWAAVAALGKKDATTKIKLYRGASLAPGTQLVFQSNASVVPYVSGSVLWIIGTGAYRTKCADASTGHVAATGTRVFSLGDGAMLSADGRAFMVRDGYRNPTRLLEIRPTSACTH
ncbi:MAG: YncE family protein [Acidimicrobiales bacterium]